MPEYSTKIIFETRLDEELAILSAQLNAAALFIAEDKPLEGADVSHQLSEIATAINPRSSQQFSRSNAENIAANRGGVLDTVRALLERRPDPAKTSHAERVSPKSFFYNKLTCISQITDLLDTAVKLLKLSTKDAQSHITNLENTKSDQMLLLRIQTRLQPKSEPALAS